MHELDFDLVSRCKVVMDTKEARDVGDLRNANDNGFVGLLGDVIAGGDEFLWSDYSTELNCTLFKSVGTVIQDIITADAVIRKARELGVSTNFDF